MRSATSYFKISPAVIKDDFRRFWAIPVIGFIYYFFSSVFIILMQMKQASPNEYGGDTLASFISTLLSGENIFNLINVIWMSVLSVLLVFRYLHNSGHVIAVHSQPFTRSTLLNSHALSCVLFLAIPIIITGVILLVIAHPVYYSSTYYDSSDEMVDLFARANVLRWMWESFITGLFIMAISIAAGMVTGTSFHHAVAALGFNAVTPLCTLLLTLYFNTYLFGYVQPDWIGDVISHMSPVINVMEYGFLSAKENALYIVLTVLIYAFAMFLYNKRKLERATDGIVFKAVDVLVTLIFGYLGMTGLGLALYSMFDQSKGAATFGYIAGAVLGIVIVRMVIMKTVRVFNKKTAVIMGGYLVIAVVFFVCLNFNVTGYESHIEEDADAVTMSLQNNGNDPILDGGTFEDADSKKAVIELHKFIIENKSLIKEIENENNNSINNVDGSMYEDVMYVGFDYMKKSENSGNKYDTVERRYYYAPAYLVLNSDAFKALAETGALNKQAINELPEADSIQYINMGSGAYYSGNSYGTASSDENMICSDKTQIAGLRAAIESDMQGMTYEDIKRCYNMPIVASFDIVYSVNNDRSKNSAAENEGAPQDILSSSVVRDKESSNTVKTSEMSLQITSYYKNTIAWMNSNGYSAIVQYDDSYWNFAVVYNIENGKATAEGESDAGELSEIPQSSDGVKVVTDPAAIKELFENVSSHVAIGALKDMNTSENNIYMVGFYHKEPNADTYYLNMTAYIDGSHVK